MPFSVSVIVPCYNEARGIAASLTALDRYLSNTYRYEIIAVDDGSTDDTAAELTRVSDAMSSLKITSNGENRGKGYSVRSGVGLATMEVVLFTDADLSTPVEEIGRALEILSSRDYDVVIGSRTLPGANIEIRQPPYRVLMGRVFAFVIHTVLGLKDLSDTQCGFKVFKKDAAKDIFARQTLDRFAFDVEILFLAQQLGYRVYEMPVTWRNRKESTVHPLRDALRMFRDVLAIKRRHPNPPAAKG